MKKAISIREHNRRSRDERDPNSLRNRLHRIATDQAREAIAEIERREAAKRKHR